MSWRDIWNISLSWLNCSKVFQFLRLMAKIMILLYKEHDFYSSVIAWNLHSETDFDVASKHALLPVLGVQVDWLFLMSRPVDNSTGVIFIWRALHQR